MSELYYSDGENLHQFTADMVGAADKSHTHSYDDLTDKPTIPTVPSAMKNPNALTIQTNGTSQATYDGSAAKTVDITPTNIGALPASTTYATSTSVAGDATRAEKIKDSYNGNNLTITYGKPGQSSTSWLGSWNGTELGAISPANITAGTATRATKLSATQKGSATQPVYISADGVPTATTYTLKKSVPSNAAFTDTKQVAVQSTKPTDPNILLWIKI